MYEREHFQGKHQFIRGRTQLDGAAAAGVKETVYLPYDIEILEFGFVYDVLSAFGVGTAGQVSLVKTTSAGVSTTLDTIILVDAIAIGINAEGGTLNSKTALADRVTSPPVFPIVNGLSAGDRLTFNVAVQGTGTTQTGLGWFKFRKIPYTFNYD